VLKNSKDAGCWIQKNPKYLSWQNSERSSLLYITANAGCGKTTLAAHIYHTIERADQGQSEINGNVRPVFLYFFFQRSNREADGTAISALRTIINQLLQQLPVLLPIALHRYESLSARGHFEWSWESLCTMIDAMFDQISSGSQVYIILDAMDECEDDSKQLVLDWACGLVNDRYYSAVPTAGRPVTRVLITSRPDEGILDRLYQFAIIEITESDTSKDMQAMIRSRVEDFCSRRSLDFEAKASITRFLDDNAHGMFLWVVLVLEDLACRDERLSDAVIASKLSRIPMTLLKTYETLIQIPLQSRRHDMWRVIRWLLYSKRGLTVAELETALCLETGISRWHDFPGDLKYLCGSLIRYDGTHGEVHLVHQTARDFLKQFVSKAAVSDIGYIPMDATLANEHIANICVQYLLRPGIFTELGNLTPSRIKRQDSSVLESFWSRYPFLRYAVGNWFSHTHAIGQPSPIFSKMVVNLLLSNTRRDGIIELFFDLTRGNPFPPVGASALHLAAFFDLPWLVEIYISQSSDHSIVHAMADSNDTPLVWASEMGSVDCVKLLLHAGADPKKVEFDGWSPLHWAATNGHLYIAELLLQHGAKVDQRDSKNLRPLDWALRTNNLDVAEVLEAWQEDMENSSMNGNSGCLD
jgi:hypothetical protein